MPSPPCLAVTDSQPNGLLVVYCRQYALPTLPGAAPRRNCRTEIPSLDAICQGRGETLHPTVSGPRRPLPDVTTEGVDTGVSSIVEARAVM